MSEDFLQVENVDAYTMRAHLSDPDPHPQYVKNSNEAIGDAIGSFLHDNPLAITGVLGSLEDVELTEPTTGQVLVFNGQKWVNESVESTGIGDVKIDSKSIVVDNVAYIPLASTEQYGVIRLATANEAARGTSNSVGITPADVKTYLENFKSNMTGAITVTLFGDANSFAWSIHGEETVHYSGDIVELIPGEYIIDFHTFNDHYNVPASRTIRVYGGSLSSIGEEFTFKFATITVAYNNPDITWKIRGSETVYIGGGTANIDSSKVVIIDFVNAGHEYNTPESIRTAVCLGDNLHFDISDLIKPASGKVTVTLMDSDKSMSSNSGWFIEYPDGTRSGILKSGDTIELPKHEEAYKLMYVDVEKYSTPHVQEIVISDKDQKLYYTGVYRLIEHPVYGVRVVRGSANTKLTGVIYNRLDMDAAPQLVADRTAWPCKLTAHDFRRCLVQNRQVVKYLNSTDSSKDEDGNPVNLDGSEGDVMVEIQPVYFKVVQVGKDSSGLPIEDWIISRLPFPGSVLHPYFHVGRTSLTDNTPYVQYLGAFESVLCDSTGTPYDVADDAQSPKPYATGDCCRSVKGYKPATNISLDHFRDAHNVANLDNMNFLAMRFIALMMFVEYRDLNSQEDRTVNDANFGCAGNRSDGFVWYNADFNYKFTRKTGRADNFGNKSGEVKYDPDIDQPSLPDNFISSNGGNTNNKKVVGFTYRGIENPFGHIFKYMDGVLLNTSRVGYYLTDMPSKYVSTIAKASVENSGYTYYPVQIQGGRAYIELFEFTEANPSFLPLKTTTEEGKYLPDMIYMAAPKLMVSGMTYLYNNGAGSFTRVILSRQYCGIASLHTSSFDSFSGYGARAACSIRSISTSPVSD